MKTEKLDIIEIEYKEPLIKAYARFKDFFLEQPGYGIISTDILTSKQPSIDEYIHQTSEQDLTKNIRLFLDFFRTQESSEVIANGYNSLNTERLALLRILESMEKYNVPNAIHIIGIDPDSEKQGASRLEELAQENFDIRKFKF